MGSPSLHECDDHDGLGRGDPGPEHELDRDERKRLPEEIERREELEEDVRQDEDEAPEAPSARPEAGCQLWAKPA